MQFDDLERKVRRLFGDEFDIVIEKQDIIDWTNAAQHDIARKTNCLPMDVIHPANTFPVLIDDLYSMYRLTYGDPAFPKTFTTLEQVDSDTINFGAIPVGTPSSYYTRGRKIYLHPTPDPSDVTSVTVTYDRAPIDLVLTTNEVIDLPAIFHEDIVRFVLARAYEKNENYEAQNMAESFYQENLAQRYFEASHGDESFPFVRPDPMDWT